MDVLKLNNINKLVKNNLLLNNISLECKTDEIITIFGRNGSGKSSLFKIILGLDKNVSPLIYFNEAIINPTKIIEQKIIAYLPQDSFIPKSLKVSNVISMFYNNDGAKQDVIYYSPRINKLQDKKVGNLSLGELRYFEFLLISNLNHPFLFFDEPFSMIEPIYIELIKEKLLQLKKEKGIILSDHYYYDAMDISDINFILKHGKLIPIKNYNDLIINGYIPDRK